MDNMPLISVIIPVYNIEDCLERCVKSVGAQEWKNLEILLVDDGSTDNSGALCDKLALADRRIRVFHKENGGSSSARNLGIEMARGDWLGFVDSDDWIEPGMYGLLLETARQYNVALVSVSRDEIDEEGRRRPDVCTPPVETTVASAQEFLRELLLHRGDCSFCTKLVRRDLLENRRFPEGKLNEDFRLLTQLLEDGYQVVTLPLQLYHVFYRTGSNTRKKDKNDFSRVFVDIVENADWVFQVTERSFPKLYREAIRFGLCQRLDYMLHIPLSRMNGQDLFYRNVKRWLRRRFCDTLSNPYLSKKNRVYLILLTIAPKTVRRVHRLKMAITRAD